MGKSQPFPSEYPPAIHPVNVDKKIHVPPTNRISMDFSLEYSIENSIGLTAPSKKDSASCSPLPTQTGLRTGYFPGP